MLSRFSRREDAGLFLALSLLASAIVAATVAVSASRVGRIFPGFVTWDNLTVVALGRPDWTGSAAGVPPRARLATVDGRPVADRADVDAAIAGDRPGTVHRYGFETPGGSESRDVATMRFGAGDWATTMGVYLFNGVVFLLTGLAVFFLRPESPQGRAVLAFGTTWGTMIVAAVALFTAGDASRWYFLAEALCPVAILHLTSTFPSLHGTAARRWAVLAPLYLAAAGVGLVEVLSFHRSPSTVLALSKATWIATLAAGAISIATTATSAWRDALPIARRRARVVLAGTITAFLVPLVAVLGFFVFGLPISSNMVTLTGFLFPVSIGYAVARHDLFEADRFVKLSLVWAAITAIVSLAYGASVFLADRFAEGLDLARSPMFPVAFVLVVLATIAPLRDALQRGVDRLFFRGRVDFKETVAAASARMANLLDRDSVVDHLVTTMRDVLFLEGTTVWEREEDEPRLVARAGADRPWLEADPAALGILASRPGGLSRDEVEESPRLGAARGSLRRLFDATHATLLLPLVGQGRLAGLIGVGRKVSGAPLSSDDVDVLRTLATETSVGLANAAAVDSLRETQSRLDRAEHLAAIGELSTAVAHGIRNPLAGIRLATQLGLEQTAETDGVRENLEDVLVEVDKLESQVSGILDFARPFEPRLEEVRVRDLVDGLVETVGPQAVAAGVALRVEDDGAPPVLVDPAHVRQAILEVLANGLQATPAGGTITIRIGPREARGPGGSRGRRVRLVVEDDGPGVPAELHQRIFQLFATTKAKGTGVGLAVARKIVERHGGTLVLEDAVPHGARFVFELPAA